MIKYIFLCITFFVSNSYCQLPIKQCANGENKPTYLDVVNCKEMPCTVVTGTTAVMYMNFTAPELIDTLQAKILANVGGLNVPYPLPQPDACKALSNTHCPLEVNEPAQYKLEMPILSIFPEIGVTLSLYLEANGVKDNKVVCCIIDIQVVKP
ncbi:hypothetical protein RN001_009008 [Aquatica leii]|uniref:MD-2-related lipid-recognition domain-containing protein n=1 Tax=Aquatica leii TaxID=1421715 RepID=A0AAN7PUX9_9COLE|nr:hypothetical protein RN001_009008 [Aquatica leii]